MNRSNDDTRDGAYRIPIAGLLGWLLPGAGHLFIGERVRGIIFLAVIAVTFWTGVAIGGVKNTVNPHERTLWFLGQVGAGSHTLGVLAWSRRMPEPELPGAPELYAYGRAEEVSVVYTAICGMLNILIIFDVLVRAENRPVTVRSGGPSRASGGATS